jgi:hypothetical protein
MVHNQAANFLSLATQFVLGSIALALAALACFGLHVDFASTAFAYSIAIAPVIAMTNLAAVGGLITLSGTSKEND